jgi:hypothetical protein
MDAEILKDIKSPVEYPFSHFWLIVVSAIFVIVIASVGIYYWRKKIKKENKPAIVLTPAEKALKDLKELQQNNLLSQGLEKYYYELLSGILRRYVEERFSIKAPEMTTDEFLIYIKNSNTLDVKYTDRLKEFLTLADLVKFAKYSISKDDAVKSFEEVYSFVEQTK